MIKSREVENHLMKSKPIHDKNSQEARDRGKLPQVDKNYLLKKKKTTTNIVR